MLVIIVPNSFSSESVYFGFKFPAKSKRVQGGAGTSVVRVEQLLHNNIFSLIFIKESIQIV